MNERQFSKFKRSGNTESLHKFFRGLPKGGLLHLHLSGAIPVDEIMRVSDSYVKVSERGDPRRPRFSLISSREWNAIKLRLRDFRRRRGPSAKRNDLPWYYRRLDSFGDEQKDEVRENLLLRETVPSSESNTLIGPGYRPTLFSLPEEFEKRFSRVDSLTGDPRIMIRLISVVLNSLWEDNIGYVEIILNPFDKVLMEKRAVQIAFGKDSDGYREAMSSLGNRYEFEIRCAEHVLRRYINQVYGFNASLRKLSHVTQFRVKQIDVRFLIGMSRSINDRSVRSERLQQCFDLADRFHRHSKRRYVDRVVGINLVGNEFRGRPTDYLQWMRQGLEKFPDVKVTLHAGESSVDDGHVLDSVLLGAKRIGHGLSLQYSPETMRIVKNRGLTIEACPLSNKMLGFVPNLEKHPAKGWIKSRMRVCINSDDPGIFDTTMTDEIFYSTLAFDLSLEEIRRICSESITSSFAPENTKTQLFTDCLNLFDQYVSRYTP